MNNDLYKILFPRAYKTFHDQFEVEVDSDIWNATMDILYNALKKNQMAEEIYPETFEEEEEIVETKPIRRKLNL